MRKSFLIGGAVAVLIAGGGGYAAWYSSDLERAKRDVREHLVDPASAIFSNVEPCDEGDKLRYVAGYVNSRNSMGGMTGNRRFLAQAVGGGFIVTVESGDRYDNPNLGDEFARAGRYAMSHRMTYGQIEQRAMQQYNRYQPSDTEAATSSSDDGGDMQSDNLSVDDPTTVNLAFTTP
jgi:hypothetical protein